MHASTQDVSGLILLGVEQGGLEQTRYSNFRPAPNTSFFICMQVLLLRLIMLI